MKNQIVFIITLFIFNFSSKAQILFEDAYFIDNDGIKTECLIKNLDWKYNPKEIEYKIGEEGEVQISRIEDIKEFGIGNKYKYIKAKVDIDRSSNSIMHLTKNRSPKFSKEVLLLKVLLEGKASLYLYEEPNFLRFFFKLEDSDIEQLVYKKYIYQGPKSSLIEEKTIAQNNSFRQQLFINLKCKDISNSDVENLDYKKRDLLKLFLKYNNCVSSEITNYDIKVKRDLFNLSITPGLNLNSLKIGLESSEIWDTDFGTKTNFRIGVETEFVFPFYKNKWSMVIEPTYQSFNKKIRRESEDISGGYLITKVDYQSVEFPIGLRHYFYLNDNSKVFVNIFYVFDYARKSNISFYRDNNTLLNTYKIEPRRNMSFGFGYKFKERYGVEARFFTNRTLLGDYLTWESNYKAYSLIFSYTLF